ncbi:unnamed protein product [Mytilus coruscus]|uniref:Uncharacterized protein n=1 Tax=Mytilus coruscus TaxID=42192 RepID=A0A6J8B641_MYTCO|nr:unnamed protein product [Mytilus coruscus]
MLPYFAAAGHNLYLKSAYVYLQQMHELSSTNPAINKALMSGFHVMRRSDRFWSGLSSDLVIEQVLMRCIKTTGGLTRDKELRNIETGATGDNSVNTDNALVVGHNIISSMEGKYIDEFEFKRKNQVTTLSSKLNIKVNNEEIYVDPQLLFPRLVTTANTMFQDVSEVFKY